jgi:hypothetical protein
MRYKGESCMDSGWFMGSPEGLLWFPPAGYEDRKPKLIPWSEVLDEDERSGGEAGDL